MCSVEAFYICTEVCQFLEDGNDRMFNVVPKLVVEPWPKPVMTRTSIDVLEEGILDFFSGEGGVQVAKRRELRRVKVLEWEETSPGCWSAEKVAK